MGINKSTAVTFDDVMGVANKVYLRLLTQDGAQPTPSDVEEEQRVVRQVGEALLHAAGARVPHMGGSTWEGAAVEFVTMFLGYVAVSASKAENEQRVRGILAQGGPGAAFIRNGVKTIDLSDAVAELMARRGEES